MGVRATLWVPTTVPISPVHRVLPVITGWAVVGVVEVAVARPVEDTAARPMNLKCNSIFSTSSERDGFQLFHHPRNKNANTIHSIPALLAIITLMFHFATCSCSPSYLFVKQQIRSHFCSRLLHHRPSQSWGKWDDDNKNFTGTIFPRSVSRTIL